MNSCATCGSSLDGAQRFCLECGARAGVPLRVLLGLDVAPAVGLDPVPAAGERLAGSWMPSPRVAAVAVMAMLAFGVIVGGVAGPGTDSSLAAARATIVVQMPPPAPAPAPAPGTNIDTSSAGGAPEPSAPTPAAVPAPAVAPAAPEPSAPVQTTPTDTPATPPPPPPKAPPIKHVWVIDLADQGYARTFGDATAMPYLTTLKSKGELLSGLMGSASTTADAGATLLGGKRCPAATGAAPASLLGAPPASSTSGPPAAAPPTSCAFGPQDLSLPDQLTGNGLGWRGYLESVTPSTPIDCKAPPTDPRNPFLFFPSISASPECGSNLAGTDRLLPDAADPAGAPAWSLIVPGPCHSGLDTPCAPDAPAGPAAADAWLQTVIDPLMASKAFADKGLIVVTTDRAAGDTTACCGDLEPAGGKVGALLLTSFVKPGTELGRPFDTLSLLHGTEDIFNLHYLGDADRKGLPTFDTGVWTNWSQNVDKADTGS